jgi:predicted transcriptional regulator
MAIDRRPEFEELIRQETWLSDHRQEIADKIEEGWKATERGELVAHHEVGARMKSRKQSHDPHSDPGSSMFR